MGPIMSDEARTATLPSGPDAESPRTDGRRSVCTASGSVPPPAPCATSPGCALSRMRSPGPVAISPQPQGNTPVQALSSLLPRRRIDIHHAGHAARAPRRLGLAIAQVVAAEPAPHIELGSAPCRMERVGAPTMPFLQSA